MPIVHFYSMSNKCYKIYISNVTQSSNETLEIVWQYVIIWRSSCKLPHTMYLKDNIVNDGELSAEHFSKFFCNSRFGTIRHWGLYIFRLRILVEYIYDQILKLTTSLNSAPNGILNYFLKSCICAVSQLSTSILSNLSL